MPKHGQVNEDVARAARAVAALRERAGVTQEQAAESHEKDITKQYWSMHESGRVPGIVKPETQRRLLAAITKAAKLDEPLTLDDLADEMSSPNPTPREARELRMARSFPATPRRIAAAPAAANGRQAVFPLSTGDAVIQLPANMTPEAFGELEAYLAVFLKANAPKD